MSSPVGVAVAGCGDDDGDKSEPPEQLSFEQELADAAAVSAADFPPAGARTLDAVAGELTGGDVDVGLAVSELVPGENRLAFGIIDRQGSFVLGKSAVYFARSGSDRAEGPFPAPADSLIVEPRFRSKQSVAEGDLQAAIYATEINLPRPGRYNVLVATRVGERLLRGLTQIRVARSSPVPEPGERAPSISTPTEDSVRDIETIETRVPPDGMHETDFKDVIGRRPVALLFATPALCESRTCGPVTDVLEALRQRYGDRMAFIHQEVFVDNDPAKGYRSQLRRFNLRSEPWLFTFTRDGRVAARLEGSFGMSAARRAIEAAL